MKFFFVGLTSLLFVACGFDNKSDPDFFKNKSFSPDASNEIANLLIFDQAYIGAGKQQNIKKDILYGVMQLQIAGKIKNGYLVQPSDLQYGGMNASRAVLMTDEEFQEGQVLYGGLARYLGISKFTTANGFEQKIYTFQLDPNYTNNH